MTEYAFKYSVLNILGTLLLVFFFFSSRRRHTRYWRDWSSDVCSSDLEAGSADPNHLGEWSASASQGGRPLKRRTIDSYLDTDTKQPPVRVPHQRDQRSEERRVGKEGRSRWSPEP